MTQPYEPAIRSSFLDRLPRETGIGAVLLCIIAVGHLATPNFLTLSNVKVLLLNGAVIGFLCLGQTFVLLTGGIDLSTGSIVAMSCVFAAVLMQYAGIPWPLAVVLVMGIGIVTGMISGLIIHYAGVPPFIVTFAMQGVAASIPQIITGANFIMITQKGYALIGQSRPLGVPFPVIALVMGVACASVFLKKTVTGTHICAVGGNAEASRLAGINIRKITVLVYAISGFCAACGGLIYGSRIMVGSPNPGRVGDDLFFSIAASVVGGVSLFGGIGTILGAMIGAVMIATVSNLMNVLSINPFWQPLVIGLIILGGVTFDTLHSSKRLRLPWKKLWKSYFGSRGNA
ncbi:MAG: ABC transporter permease [Synergistaceae bacterium]|jgi:ribose transport system permease protein|nr:ABC transporter permease [Synergistaceae bacterium]